MDLAIFLVGALFGGSCVFFVDLTLIKKLRAANCSLFEGLKSATRLVILMSQREKEDHRPYLQ